MRYLLENFKPRPCRIHWATARSIDFAVRTERSKLVSSLLYGLLKAVWLFLRTHRHQLDRSLTLRIRCPSEIVARQEIVYSRLVARRSQFSARYNFFKKHYFCKLPYALFLPVGNRSVGINGKWHPTTSQSECVLSRLQTQLIDLFPGAKCKTKTCQKRNQECAQQ